MEHIIEQDIRKGYSVVAIDPKGDIDLFSKIVEIADDTDRLEDLMLVTPIFPEYSAIIDPLSSSLVIQIDEAQSVLYQGIEDLFCQGRRSWYV